MCHIKNGESELISTSFPESSFSSTASDSAPFSPTVVVLADATNYTVKVLFLLIISDFTRGKMVIQV